VGGARYGVGDGEREDARIELGKKGKERDMKKLES